VPEEPLSSTQIALEARQTASATLGSLQEQGNQLKRVNRDVDDVRNLEDCLSSDERLAVLRSQSGTACADILARRTPVPPDRLIMHLCAAHRSPTTRRRRRAR